DLLQYILVDGHDHAAAGLSFVRAGGAGRCGFVVAGGTPVESPVPVWSRMAGITAVTEAVRITGPFADTHEQAVAFARVSDAPVATLEGDVLRGAHLVSGGTRVEARGILATRREIKELSERTAAERQALLPAADAVTQLEAAIAAAAGSLTAMQAEQHEHEKSLVGFDAQLARTVDESARLARKADQIGLERRRAEEERGAADARRQEAEEATARLVETQREADARLTEAQRRLAEARDAVSGLAIRLAEAGATHAGLVERAAALVAEVARLEDSARELEERVDARKTELTSTRERREALL